MQPDTVASDLDRVAVDDRRAADYLVGKSMQQADLAETRDQLRCRDAEEEHGRALATAPAVMASRGSAFMPRQATFLSSENSSDLITNGTTLAGRIISPMSK